MGSLAAQPHNGGRFTVALTPPPHPLPRRPHSAPGSTSRGPFAPPLQPWGGAATARRDALPPSRFPPPSLGSRKTRSEPALPGGACSVASRFSSLVGSSSATPAAAAAAAAAPRGSQIPQQRPRALPLPRQTPAPAPPGPGSLAPRGPRCAERAPRPQRLSTRPPPAAGSAAGPGPARERNPGGRRPRRRAVRGGAGEPGRVGGARPRGGGAGCRRRRLRAVFALRGWCPCRVGGRARASPRSPLSRASPAARRPEGAGPSGGAAALFRAASSPSRGSLARPPPPLSPPRGAPGAPCRRSSCRTSFSARRTRPSGGGCWCRR